MAPLANLIVLEFCQYMSGPSAGLRLADLGAQVIKIERPGTGESGRQLSIKNLFADDNSILFHTINRHKQSYTADLKAPSDLAKIKKLIEQADVLMHNFRPGVMEKLGLDYESVHALNPRLVYGVISGYGSTGPWKQKPGQDLLLQSISGLSWLSGNRTSPPVPFGLSIADYMCGTHLTHGILAALIQRQKTKKGALIEVNLLSSLIDFQFEVITTHLNDKGRLPDRAASGNAHAYLSAPYGVYATKDGHLALAMEDLQFLRSALDLPEITDLLEDAFLHRDAIMTAIAGALRARTTGEWLSVFEPADIWCAEVLNYQQFTDHEGFKGMKLEQEIVLKDGQRLKTTRCPIRMDGEIFYSQQPAPGAGEHNQLIDTLFRLS
ncbi:MAG TPA: CaiB/BaiF CoA-transferase family protein [Arachidicoccus sp.]|nr:CaiB/BaiF CoA-transferase family protein [Arachidicoccus sp.]